MCLGTNLQRILTPSNNNGETTIEEIYFCWCSN